MKKEFSVTFPGEKRVAAHYNGFTVQTDQSVKNGGKASAPEPFDLFFVSLATCAGIYVLEFCQARDLNTEGLAVQLHAERDDAKKLFTPISIDITLPADFPEKYRNAIIKTANLCTVKKHILGQPEFDVRLVNWV